MKLSNLLNLNFKKFSINNWNKLLTVIIFLIGMILLIVILKNNKRIYETFQSVCEIRSQGNTFVDCYYKRLTEGDYSDFIETYYSEIYLLKRPEEFNADRFADIFGLLIFYLKYYKNFPRIGCGDGWENNFSLENINTVISDYGYYLYRAVADKNTLLFSQITSSSSTNISQLNLRDTNNNYFKYYSGDQDETNLINDINNNLSESSSNDVSFFNIVNQGSSDVEKAYIYVILINFIAMYILNKTRRGYNSLYRWGVPTYKDRLNVPSLQDITSEFNGFNYKYNIIFDMETTISGNTITQKKVVYRDTYANYYLMNFENTDGNSSMQTEVDKQFKFEFNDSCGDYFYIMNKQNNKYLKKGNVIGTSGDDANSYHVTETTDKSEALHFYIDNYSVNNDLTFDINEILIPQTGKSNQNNYEMRTGSYVTLLCKDTNIDDINLFSYLSFGNNETIDIPGRDETINKLIIRIVPFPSTDSDEIKNNSSSLTLYNIYTSSFFRFRFVRQLYDSIKKYVYKEKLMSDTSEGAPSGVKLDMGDIFLLDNNDTTIVDTSPNPDYNPAGAILNLNDVETQQKVFPFYNDNASDFSTSDSNQYCNYTGKQSTLEGVKTACVNDDGCYGEFESNEDNFKRIYSGKKCTLPLKYIDNTGPMYENKIRRGAVYCNSNLRDNVIQPIQEGQTDNLILSKEVANICYLPKNTDVVQPNGLLNYSRKDVSSFCKENRDYGILDGSTYQMYVNNSNCEGRYTYANNLLNTEGENCNNDGKKCEFSDFLTRDNKTYIMNNDFTTVKNKNIELKGNLKDLKEKLGSYHQKLQTREEINKAHDEKLVGSLNDFKFVALNDQLNRLNEFTFNEINKQDI